MTKTAWHYRGSKAFKQWLARNRHRPVVRCLARYAWQVVRGYENASNDFAHNGERFLLENVAGHTPGRVLFDVGARGRRTQIGSTDLQRIAATFPADNRRMAAFLDGNLGRYGYLMDEQPHAATDSVSAA